MMKKFIAAAAILAAVFSCSKEQNVPSPEENTSKPITIQASFADMNTKVSFEASYDAYGKPAAMALTWADGDKLRVYNHADKTQYSDFELTGGKGTKSGSFTGTPVAATSYDVEIVNGEVTYGTQTQPSDGETTNLKYMASVQGITDLSTLVFDNFSSVLAITAQMPSSAIAAKIKSVDITASEAIFNGGNTLTIEFETIGDAGNDGILHFFANLPQGDQAIAAGTTLMVKFNAPGEDHDVYTRFITLGAQTFTADKLNAINISAANSASFANTSTTNIGQSTNPYLIGDKYQLAAIASELSTSEKKYFKLIDDITLSGWNSINCNDKDKGGAIDFDGNGKTISSLNKPFFEFFNGKVSDLTLSNATLSAAGSNYYGVLARTVDGANSCELTNVSVINSSVTAKGTIGGLVGKIDSSTACTLTNCSADVAVTGTAYYVGGLVGQVTKGTLTHCSATGVVSTSSYYASALVGFIHGTVSIEKCYATGDIKPTVDNTVANTGGIVGYMDASADLTILNCYYAGTIGTDAFKHRRWSGGILGRTGNGSKISVTNCYASFFVKTGNANVDGALVGNSESSSVTCSGYVGWSSFSKMAGTGTTVSADGNYLGTEGTISAKAKEFGWDANIWDLTGDVPVLK